MQNLIDLINVNDGEAALIFLDQEKAFDRMDHSFIFKTLNKFGFGDNFIGWVKTLCKDTKSFVKINGHETMEFNIERGVRQGCCLSPLLYILAAESLSTHIRKNKKIRGFRYKMKNLEQLEHKIVQYADDTNVCITNMSSLEELFKTLTKYEKATNAKINKDKTEALWVGKWRGRTDKPFDLKWKCNSVKFTGIYVGNKVGASGTKQLSELNFAEQIEKIKNKIKYWKGKGISLIGRVKVVNIFLLSRLWYRTQIWNLNNTQKDTLESLIRNYIWRDKTGGRVRQGVLNLGIEKGGLQLVDIGTKIKTQRIKRIMYLLSIEDDNIERFLADSLIGKDNRFGQNGLSYGIISNPELINQIKNDFYKNALQAVNSIGIAIKPGSLRLIQNEPLFYNKMFLDTNEQFFTLTRFKRMMPKTVKQLQSQSHSREPFIIETIQNILVSLNRVSFSDLHENSYLIEIEGSQYDLNSLEFKDIYINLLKGKNEAREWEPKWQNYLRENEINWKRVWENLHNNIHNPIVKSSNWELLHLNFWCGYKAREMCKLCREEELNSAHIANNCKVLIEILKVFQIYDKYNNKMDMSFGLFEDHYHNFILFHVKSVVFKSRFEQYTSKEHCITALTNKTRYKIRKDIQNRYEWAKIIGNLATFSHLFNLDVQTNNITKLCSLNAEREFIFYI